MFGNSKFIDTIRYQTFEIISSFGEMFVKRIIVWKIASNLIFIMKQVYLINTKGQ